MSDDCFETRDLDQPTPPRCELAFAPHGSASPDETLAGLLDRLQRKFAVPRGGGAAHETPSTPDVGRGAPCVETVTLPAMGSDADGRVILAEPCSDAERVILAAIQRRRRYDGITAHELAAQAGVNERSARAIVAHLIVEHEVPICGTPMESYYWPARMEDMAPTMASIQSRRSELEARLNGLRRGASRLFGTLEMFEER